MKKSDQYPAHAYHAFYHHKLEYYTNINLKNIDLTKIEHTPFHDNVVTAVVFNLNYDGQYLKK